MTTNYVVLLDLLLLFNPGVALNPASERDLPYRWDDRYPARLVALTRDRPQGTLRCFAINPSYVFNVANAHGPGHHTIVIEVLRYDHMWRKDGDFAVVAALWRWKIHLETGAVDETQLDDRAAEI